MSTPRVELEQQLQMEKDQLRTSLETLGNRASEAVDWREHVRKRPMQTLGAAVALGAIVGAVTKRSAMRPRSEKFAVRAGSSSRPTLPSSPSAVRPEWNRVRAGLAGLVADRALVVAQDFLERVTHRPPASTKRP